MPGVSEETVKAASSLFRSGLSAYEIASRLLLSRQHVYRALHKAGIFPDGTGSDPFPQEYPRPSVDQMWAAEFRGLFYGDGCIYIGRRNYKKGHLYLPRMSVLARSDNRPMLEDLVEKLGGKIQDKGAKPSGKYICNPSCQWYLSGWSRCRGAIEAVSLCDGLIPAKKAREISLVYEAILVRYSMPYRLGPANVAILKRYYERSKELKHFKVQAG